MNLRQQFKSLGLPTGDAEFVAERLVDRPHVRLARDRTGRAAVLVAHVDGSASAAPTIELRHLAFWASAECEITSSDGVRSGVFAVIRWKSEAGHLQDLFLGVLGSWIATLGRAPSMRTIRSGFDRLAEIFAALEVPSGRDIAGLWGELLVIGASSDPEPLVRAWHADPNEIHDFRSGVELLEVKAATTGIRRHEFSLAQLTWPPDGRLLVASLLLSGEAPTSTLAEVLERVRARLSSDELRLRVDAIVVATLGSAATSALSHRFNVEASTSTIRFFDGGLVPTVDRRHPAEVSDVRFKSELDGIPPLDCQTMSAVGALFRASQKRVLLGEEAP